MAWTRSLIPGRLSRRMCLSCGYAGRPLQREAGETIFACPRCGADLYARPPKSYAEMEGLADSNVLSEPTEPTRARPAMMTTCSASEARTGSVRGRWALIGLGLAAVLLLLGQVV